MRRAFLGAAIMILGAVAATFAVSWSAWFFWNAPQQSIAIPSCPDGSQLYAPVYAFKYEMPDFHCFDPRTEISPTPLASVSNDPAPGFP